MLKAFLKLDWIIVICVLILASIGVLMVYSTSVGDPNQASFVIRQFVYVLVGLVIFFLVSRINFRIIVNLSVWFYLLIIFLLIVTFIIGSETRGSIRWLDFRIFTLQASELAKPVTILLLSYFFTRFRPNTWRSIGGSLLIILIPVAFIFRQPDLGSALILLIIWVSLTYLAGIRWKQLLVILIILAISLPLGFGMLKSYQKERLLTFLNPAADPLGTGYNLVQSIIAVGSGQGFGIGFGRGTQSHLNFLPEQKTDFIFATTAEELGFVGVSLILAVFLVLIYRIIRVANSSDSKSGTLICYGTVTVLMTQLFVNAGMNMGMLPITGIPLPFISFGGSSLVSLMILLGLVESIHLHRKDPLDLIRNS